MTFQRTMVCLVLGIAASTAFAQKIGDGYEGVRDASKDVRLTLTGTDTRLGGTRFRTELTYSDGAKELVEQLEYSGSLAIPDPSLPLVRRVVGDGITLWAYNGVRNDYTALRYGLYNGPQVASYRDDFFHALGSGSRGVSTATSRLVTEIYGDASNAVYKPWIPGPSANVLPLSLDDPAFSPRLPVWPPTPIAGGYQDPVNSSVVYVPVPGVVYQFYYEPNLNRSIAFENTQDSTTGIWYLTGVFSNQAYSTGMLSWKILVERGPVIDPNTFTFVPPKNARAIVSKVGG